MLTYTDKKTGLCNFMCKFLKFYYHNYSLNIQILYKKDFISNNVVEKTNDIYKLEKYNPDWLFHLWLIHNETLKIYKLGLNKIIITENIIDYVEKFRKTYFNNKTISVHIRSWHSETNVKTNNDKAKTREKTFDINTFIYHMKKFKENNFFISSDNNKYNDILIKNFKDRLIFYKKSNKLSVTQNDYANVLLLSKNTIFIASYKSSFSQIAYLYNNNLKTLIYGDYIKEDKSRYNPVNESYSLKRTHIK